MNMQITTNRILTPASRMRGVLRRLLMAVSLCLLMSSWAMAESKVTLNIKETELAAVVEMVARETNRNFVVDPRVKGKISIVSARPVSKSELYEIFLSVLDVHGFVAVPTGDVIKIVPAANAKHMSSEDSQKGGDDAFITQVIQVQNVSAMQLVPILRPLVPPNGHMAAHAQSNTLILSTQLGNIDRLVQIIKRIDQPSSGEVEVITLQHASAAELVRILDTLKQQERKGADPQESSTTLVADERTNSILIGGDPTGRLKVRALIGHLDTPTETTGNTNVIYLRYAKAKDLVPVMTGIADSQLKEQAGKGQGQPKGLFEIQAHEATNSLVITAPPDVFRALSSVVRRLDIRRAQVLVEAVIAEVSSERAAELGVQWLFDGTPGGNGPVGLINFGSGRGSSLLDLGAAVASGGAVIPRVDGTLLGAGRFNHNSLNFAALIHALEGDGSTNVLSTPSIVTLDNQEAEIVVGQTVPFITGSFSSTGNGGATATNPFQTIKRENVGITLKVMPQINEGNSIKLDIEQKVDSIAATSVSAADIVTNTRSIKTSVMVDNGKMIVLGGLIKDDLVEGVQKVPLLGDIPLLGALFRNKSATKVKTNLMVFLKPTILRDIEETARVTESKYSFIRAKQMALEQEGVSLLPNETMPVLPEPDDSLKVTAEEKEAAARNRALDNLTDEMLQHE